MIFIEDAVVVDDLEIFHLGLSNQHSVERIAMFSRESASPDRMVERNRRSIATELGQVIIELANKLLAAGQPISLGLTQD